MIRPLNALLLLLVIACCEPAAWSQGRIPMLGETAPSFEANTINGKLAFISTDDLSSHFAWKKLMEDILAEHAQSEEIEFPLIDDQNARVSNTYGMIYAWENQTRDVRGVFINDPENRIQT